MIARNPDDMDMRLVAKWKATRKLPKGRELLDVLITILCYHDAYGYHDDEVLLHKDLVELIGEMIGQSTIGRARFLRARNRARRRAAASLQAKADAILQNPNQKRTARAVALEIARQHGGNANTIRRAITVK